MQVVNVCVRVKIKIQGEHFAIKLKKKIGSLKIFDMKFSKFQARKCLATSLCGSAPVYRKIRYDL